MSAPICPYCGDGMESIGTLNHIECATKLLAEVERLRNAVMAGTEQWLREQQRAEAAEKLVYDLSIERDVPLAGA